MMLLFIAMANVSLYLWGQEPAGAASHPRAETLVDSALSVFAIVFVDGHVYPMFAFLFGYGITQFATARIRRGIPPQTVSRMLLRRHLWLLAFGAIHALLLFAGDILGAYALTGLALAALLLRGNDRLIRTLLWVLGTVCAGLMLLGAAGVLILSTLLPAELWTADMMMLSNADIMAGVSDYWAAMLARIGQWLLFSVMQVVTILVPFAVLLGGYAARHRWLEGTTRRLSLTTVAGWGIPIGAIGSVPAALDYLEAWPSTLLSSVGWMIIAQLCGIAGGIGYVALFGLIGQRARAGSRGIVGAIAAVGKRSLSFYLLQSLAFAPLLSAWGLGWGATISTAGAYALAGAVWLVSIAAGVLLERAGRRGPAEALLRRLTYGSDDTVPRSP